MANVVISIDGEGTATYLVNQKGCFLRLQGPAVPATWFQWVDGPDSSSRPLEGHSVRMAA
jgi:hypothetical protein